MIPQAFITEWQHSAPWSSDEQIEQDLILCRILVEMYQNNFLRAQLVFRGGTALNKLFFPAPARYSEDLDFVQQSSGPIKDIIKTIQKTIDPWLGKSSTESRKNGFRIYNRFNPEDNPSGQKRIKIEINTREHFSIFPLNELPFNVQSQWYKGNCNIPTYQLNELLGTKMRALYQRRKGRDLFDLDWCIDHCDVDELKIIHAFRTYMKFKGNTVAQKQFLNNLIEKIQDYGFRQDIVNYIRPEIQYDPERAFENVKKLISLI